MHRPVKPAQRAGFTQAWAEDCCEAPGDDQIYFSPCVILGNGTVLRGDENPVEVQHKVRGWVSATRVARLARCACL